MQNQIGVNMVYSKRDTKGQETGGNHDLRDKCASNRDFYGHEKRETHYLKYPYNEDTNALHKTDYSNYQDNTMGRRPKNEIS